MTRYLEQVKSQESAIDVEFWRHPEGVAVAHDELRFLYIPDAVEAFMVAELAKSVHSHQVQHAGTDRQITKAVMVMMGGLLPGVLLHDHLAWNFDDRTPGVEFGTLGVQYYAGPGETLESPQIVQDLTIPVAGHVTAVVEDLVDLGGTARFVSRHLLEKGARDTILIAPYLKHTDVFDEMRVIWFGIVPPDTWIITPRERVETLIKRVPHWREQGASYEDCKASLDAIGYPEYLIERYLPMMFQ